MSRRALLTGVTGFIGGKLAERLLADGWTVAAIVRPTSDTSRLPAELDTHAFDGGAARLTQIVAAATPDVVFHLASLYLAEHKPEQVDDLVASNILFPAQLAEAMTAAGATRLVNTGTAWQHYGTGDYNPVNLYAATKQACEDLLRFYHEARGVSVVTLRLFDTYGAGDKRRKLLQLLVDAAVSGEVLEMSPGEQIVDLTHVDDVVTAFVVAGRRVLDAPVPLLERFLISGERFPVRALAPLVSEGLGRPVDAVFGARPYRAREVMVPVDPVGHSLPGWQPERRLRDELAGLRQRGG